MMHIVKFLPCDVLRHAVLLLIYLAFGSKGLRTLRPPCKQNTREVGHLHKLFVGQKHYMQQKFELHICTVLFFHIQTTKRYPGLTVLFSYSSLNHTTYAVE